MNYIDFRVNRNEQQVVNGFTLSSVGNKKDKAFCLSFITAHRLGKGDVSFSDGQITFIHGGVSIEEADIDFGNFGIHEGHKFSCEISAEDSEALKALLNKKGVYANTEIVVQSHLAWFKGFTVYTKF